MSREEWLSIARNADANDLREAILTGFKAGKPFTPYIPTLDLPSGLNWVLDFGCGVGRNFPYLQSIASHVVGFDLEPMIQRCRDLADTSVDQLTYDWKALTERRFDLIVASLVLQHIETAACTSFLAAFAHLAPLTYVLTRSRSDFERNVLDIITQADCFDVLTCVKVDHDAATHQLRNLGPVPFATAAQGLNDDHYELLLRSRSFTRSDR